MTLSTLDDRLVAHPGRSLRANSDVSATCAETGYVVSVTSLFPSREVVDQWRDLATRALVPNLFYEPEFAQAASIPFGKDVKLLTISTTEDGRQRMLLAWPYRVVHRRWGIPLRVMLGWGHPFACLGVPLIDSDRAEDAVRSLLAVHRAIPGLPARALLQFIPEDGPFSEILARQRRILSRTERHDRPYWRRGEADDPLATLSSSTKSKLRQEFRRLERDGKVTHEIITDAAQLPAALEDYLALEASGWKARAGTAIPQSETETAFMRRLVADLAVQGRARIDRLRLGETTLASSITYFSGTHHAWYAKISYNEDYAKNSPGSQLVLRVTEDLRLNTSVTYADSCAPAGHPLMRKFWPTRFALSHVMVPLTDGDPLFGLASRLERLRPRIRELAYRVRDTLRSRLVRK